MTTTNPLLAPFTHPHETPPFDAIREEHYMPALEVAVERAHKRISEITGSDSAPNFENTIVALECASDEVGTVSSIFFALLHAEASEALQALAQDFAPALSAFSNEILLNAALFDRVNTVYSASQDHLNDEQKMLLRKNWLSFTRNGARLSDTDKDRLKEIDQELARLSPAYSDNVLKATNAYQMVITDEADLAGLPESTREAARETAIAADQPEAWMFNLQAPSFMPFMKYADKRTLREDLWRAFTSRAVGGDTDNSENIRKMVQLRHDRATLLGYASHAAFVLEERMAGTPEAVSTFLERLRVASLPAAQADLAALRELRMELEGSDEMKPWDLSYYSEKLKERRFNFDQEMLRPWFRLEKVVEGAFEHARRLFKVDFRESHDIPLYHPDVRTFEVYDSENERFLGVLYTDFFPRETKRSGAWMTGLRDQGLSNGELKRPHVAIVCNFTKPTSSAPSFLTYDEVETLFHEFGHALHMLLTDCTYCSLSGTNVYWDFVELPSQIMENWIQEKESLDLFARHEETGELIPEDLAQRVKESARFMAGSFSLRQIALALIDMAWHSGDPALIQDIETFENTAIANAHVLPAEAGSSTSHAFSHIFAGGYSAGYYSYKWAEVLDADAFELFTEQGLFNEEVAARFRKHILARGATEDPMALYEAFRGRTPDPDALLRRDGLL